jgi:hypothetical protein
VSGSTSRSASRSAGVAAHQQRASTHPGAGIIADSASNLDPATTHLRRDAIPRVALDQQVPAAHPGGNPVDVCDGSLHENVRHMSTAYVEELPERTATARVPDRQAADLALRELRQPIASHAVNVQRTSHTRTSQQRDARTHADGAFMI